ncbi:patatin family protein [bacterium]|nr:patatin family protein [bacterium]
MQKKKTALVLEGGGIRSSYLGGVLEMLYQNGYPHFDIVVGTSAGACCGANFIAGETHKNKTILFDYLLNGNFIKFQYSLSTKNVMDIDFLVDEVCVKHVPLNLPKIKASKSTLYMAATDFLTGKAFYFNNREHDILTALKASCAVPYMYRTSVMHHGRRYIDGGMVASIPVKKALEEGATDIVVIGTREMGYRKSPSKAPGWIHDFFYPKSAMTQAFKNRYAHYNEAIDLIENPPQGVTIDLIAPHKKLAVSRVTSDKLKVEEAYKQGLADGLAYVALKKGLGQKDLELSA